MRMTLQGTTALVTGGSRGLGRAIALRLAREGAAVAVNYRERRDDAEAVVAQIQGAGGRALAVGADVGDAHAVANMVQRIEQEFGPVAVLASPGAAIYWISITRRWKRCGARMWMAWST